MTLDKRFVREVYCSDEFGGASPDTIVVTIVPELAGKIREWSAMVKAADAFYMAIFHPTPSWYERNWEDDQEKDPIDLLGDLFAPLDTVLLHVTKDVIWWSARLDGSNIQVCSASINIEELT